MALVSLMAIKLLTLRAKPAAAERSRMLARSIVRRYSIISSNRASNSGVHSSRRSVCGPHVRRISSSELQPRRCSSHCCSTFRTAETHAEAAAVAAPRASKLTSLTVARATPAHAPMSGIASRRWGSRPYTANSSATIRGVTRILLIWYKPTELRESERLDSALCSAQTAVVAMSSRSSDDDDW